MRKNTTLDISGDGLSLQLKIAFQTSVHDYQWGMVAVVKVLADVVEGYQTQYGSEAERGNAEYSLIVRNE